MISLNPTKFSVYTPTQTQFSNYLAITKLVRHTFFKAKTTAKAEKVGACYLTYVPEKVWL